MSWIPIENGFVVSPLKDICPALPGLFARLGFSIGEKPGPLWLREVCWEIKISLCVLGIGFLPLVAIFTYI